MARSHAASPPTHDRSDRSTTTTTTSETSKRSSQSHHVRRKSGPRDEKKRPSLSRRTTPQHVKTSSARRDRDSAVAATAARDRGDEAARDRDGGESFPQFCMTCEKQFLPANSTILYCSESCRLHDQAPASTRPQSFSSTFPSLSPPASPYHQPQHFLPSDGPDIIPRFSPTQVRPRSYFNNSSSTDAYHQPSTISSSYHPTTTSHFHTSSTSSTSSSRPPTTSRSSTALASLRDLAAALPRSPQASPPRSPSAVWSYMPFQSKTATPTPSATPRGSYGSYETSDDPFVGAAAAAAAARRRSSAYIVGPGVVGVGMDRPLPPRSGPGGYGNRRGNMDLVTPFAAGW